MNEVVPDWLNREDTTRASGTALPNTIIGFDNFDNAELSHLRNKIAILESENTRLFEENVALRKKCMTRFERIKNAANIDEMAQMLHKVYMTGMGDAVMTSYPRTWGGIADISQWLQEIGTI